MSEVNASALSRGATVGLLILSSAVSFYVGYGMSEVNASALSRGATVGLLILSSAVSFYALGFMVSARCTNTRIYFS